MQNEEKITKFSAKMILPIFFIVKHGNSRRSLVQMKADSFFFSSAKRSPGNINWISKSSCIRTPDWSFPRKSDESSVLLLRSYEESHGAQEQNSVTPHFSHRLDMNERLFPYVYIDRLQGDGRPCSVGHLFSTLPKSVFSQFTLMDDWMPGKRSSSTRMQPLNSNQIQTEDENWTANDLVVNNVSMISMK